MVDVLTVIITAICTGLGVSIGNILFEMYFKDHFLQWKRNKKKRLALMRKIIHYKRPWLAALLNFFAWGVGYLYAGRKRFVGVVLLFVQLFMTEGFFAEQNSAKTLMEAATYTFLILIISGYLAYDAFFTAKARNEGREAKRNN